MRRFLTNGVRVIGLSRGKIIAVCLVVVGIVIGMVITQNNNAEPQNYTINDKKDKYINDKQHLDANNLLLKLDAINDNSKTNKPTITAQNNSQDVVPDIVPNKDDKLKDAQTNNMYDSLKGKSLMYSAKPTKPDVSKATNQDGSDVINDDNRFEVKAGSVIPSTMINGLNSELPGVVIAIVRANVYDSTTRTSLLIPQGSRLVGSYDSNVIYAQERVAVAWNKLIYPDGSYTLLKAVPGTDIEGYSGFYDQVDNHYVRLFGASFVMGVITGAIQYSQNNTNTATTIGNPTVGQTMAGSLGQQMGQTGMAITQKNLNVAPTIVIRPNYPFNLIMTSDLKLKPFARI